jgi:hypothetical protein
MASVGGLPVAQEGREILDPCTELTGCDGHVASVKWREDKHALSKKLGDGPSHTGKALHKKLCAMCAEKGK